MKGPQSKQNRQKPSPDQSVQQPEKRGRKPKLTPEQRHANKLQSDRKHRLKKAADNEALRKRNLELEKMLEELSKKVEGQQSEMNSLKEEMPELNARADEVVRDLSDEAIKVNLMKMANEGMEQQLQQKILNQVHQEHPVSSSESSSIPLDWEWVEAVLQGNLEMQNFSEFPSPLWSMSTGIGNTSGTGAGSRWTRQLRKGEMLRELLLGKWRCMKRQKPLVGACPGATASMPSDQCIGNTSGTGACLSRDQAAGMGLGVIQTANLPEKQEMDDNLLFKKLANLELPTLSAKAAGKRPALPRKQNDSKHQMVPVGGSLAPLMIGSSSGEGTSIAKAKLSPLCKNVNGFRILAENSLVIQDIFRQYPSIASGLRVHYPASKNFFMNMLAEFYKMSKQEMHTLDDIKCMEEGVQDLELSGLEISWLKDLVVKCRKKFEVKESIRSKEAELKLLKEMETELI